MQIDETDAQLIELLTQNARLPVATLARKLGIARSTVQSRLDRLEASGRIAGYTLRPGPGGREPLRATALLSVEPRASPGVLARLSSLPQVRRVHTTSGRWDLVAELAAGSTEELDEALDRIGETRGVKSSESLIHLSTKLDRGPL